MSTLIYRRSLAPLRVVLGLALMGFVFAPSASGAAQLDTATASGSTGNGFFTNINVSAQSGTSGQNPSGSASFRVFNAFDTSGPVTCLSVTGPDRGAGSVGSPTTAVLNFQSSDFGVVTVKLVDNGGNGADVFGAVTTGRSPTDCSLGAISATYTLTNGRATVFDAPLVPTSEEQCKDGGWMNYPQFKNQGDCVSFVATHGKKRPG